MMAKLLFVIEIKYSHAGIDCGVVRQTSFLLKVPRFVGEADWTTRREISRLEHRTSIMRSRVETTLKS